MEEKAHNCAPFLYDYKRLVASWAVVTSRREIAVYVLLELLDQYAEYSLMTLEKSFRLWTIVHIIKLSFFSHKIFN